MSLRDRILAALEAMDATAKRYENSGSAETEDYDQGVIDAYNMAIELITDALQEPPSDHEETLS